MNLTIEKQAELTEIIHNHFDDFTSGKTVKPSAINAEVQSEAYEALTSGQDNYQSIKDSTNANWNKMITGCLDINRMVYTAKELDTYTQGQ